MNDKNPTYFEKKITDLLNTQQYIQFAYLFGSFVTKTNYRDIDIACYCKPAIDLLEHGHLMSLLSQNINIKTDLVVLNGLYRRKPALVHKIIYDGKLIINNNNSCLKNYRSKSLTHYLDTNYLRKIMDNAFHNRLKNDQFGVEGVKR